MNKKGIAPEPNYDTEAIKTHNKNMKKSTYKDGGFILTEKQYASLKVLDNATFGLLMKSILDYHFYDTYNPNLPDLISIPYDMLKNHSDELKEKFRNKCVQNANNANTRWKK